jgi:AcrR family transcriptional regulator
MTTADAAEVRVEDSADLTAKARIRNAALELFATKGAANTSIREVAAAAGITHGLVVHHFANKDGLRQAVRQHAIELFRQALESVPGEGTAIEIRRARDSSVDRLLIAKPALMDYLRRAMLDPAESDYELIGTLAGFTLAEVRDLRSRGLAATQTPDYLQAMAVMVRELGPRLLAPVAQQFWSQLTNGEVGPAPELEVTIRA